MHVYAGMQCMHACTHVCMCACGHACMHAVPFLPKRAHTDTVRVLASAWTKRECLCARTHAQRHTPARTIRRLCGFATWRIAAAKYNTTAPTTGTPTPTLAPVTAAPTSAAPTSAAMAGAVPFGYPVSTPEYPSKMAGAVRCRADATAYTSAVEAHALSAGHSALQ